MKITHRDISSYFEKINCFDKLLNIKSCMVNDDDKLYIDIGRRYAAILSGWDYVTDYDGIADTPDVYNIIFIVKHTIRELGYPMIYYKKDGVDARRVQDSVIIPLAKFIWVRDKVRSWMTYTTPIKKHDKELEDAYNQMICGKDFDTACDTLFNLYSNFTKENAMYVYGMNFENRRGETVKDIKLLCLQWLAQLSSIESFYPAESEKISDLCAIESDSIRRVMEKIIGNERTKSTEKKSLISFPSLFNSFIGYDVINTVTIQRLQTILSTILGVKRIKVRLVNQISKINIEHNRSSPNDFEAQVMAKTSTMYNEAFTDDRNLELHLCKLDEHYCKNKMRVLEDEIHHINVNIKAIRNEIRKRKEDERRQQQFVDKRKCMMELYRLSSKMHETQAVFKCAKELSSYDSIMPKCDKLDRIINDVLSHTQFMRKTHKWKDEDMEYIHETAKLCNQYQRELKKYRDAKIGERLFNKNGEDG